MKSKASTSNLFKLLVAGGATLGSTSLFSSNEAFADEPEAVCLVEVRTLQGNGPARVECLDNVRTDVAILEIISRAKAQAVAPTCETPFCHCWLG